MNSTPINLTEKLSLFNELWTPRIISQLNDYHFKLAKFEGEFIWHSHPETDEAFLVLEGEMQILFRDGDVILHTGELFVVPRGVEHKPIANQACAVLLVEPAGTGNTGDAGGENSTVGQWI